MPARFRKALSEDAGETFVVCFAPNKRLRAYPLDEWLFRENLEKEREEQRRRDDGRSNPTESELKLKRMLYETLSETQLDAQGRFSLTPKQIKFAGLEKAVTLAGFSDERYIEIFATENQMEFDSEDFDTLFYGNSK